jgi:hypothetical protein
VGKKNHQEGLEEKKRISWENNNKNQEKGTGEKKKKKY